MSANQNPVDAHDIKARLRNPENEIVLRRISFEAADHIEALERQLTELRIANASYENRIVSMSESLADAGRDTARYHHLRDYNSGSLIIVQITGIGEYDQIVLTEEDADSAIDAAMKVQA